MHAERRPAAVFLMGPTASGKTALAVDLARRFPLSVVSVDSALVYRGLDVGSAKPDAATRAAVPHALVDIREPEDPYSAADFRRDALVAMGSARADGRVPLLVGGTGLYFAALERGLSALPAADPVLRARLEAEAGAVGWAAMHERLARLDPAAAARIHRNDPQRIQRALEVIELTGRPLSAQQQGPGKRLPWRVLKLALLPDRAVLHARIAARFCAMVDAGLLAEVAALRRRPGLRADAPSMRAVGYRQAWEHLDGATTRDDFIQRGIHATRQLAKRQVTWLRGEHDAFTLAADGGDAAHRIAGFLDPITTP
ncbi:MAG: tRNA (adenosine(37)-N6)-dimethylallyltransferase MiaA [Xanthomonadaceae bacterium]|jgi:tRNA dimethylallyltransferase|nr:tRNA (adenosine(37)-N6)-dimethylallyltransferase MiaA [Xanthomonadaceae bacterium]